MHPVKLISTNILLALCYVAMAAFGLTMAIPPGYATIFWPASGVALVGVYVFGYRLLPGVFLGSFCINILHASWPDFSFALDVGTVNAALIGCGAMAQAALAAYLLRRFIGISSDLTRLHDIMRLSFCAGVVSSLISCTVGVSTLVATHTIAADGAFFTWGTWYVGDTLGVLVFAPILILVLNPGVSRDRKINTAIPLLLFFLAVIALFFFVKNLDREQTIQDFENDSALIQNEIENEFANYVQDIVALLAFYKSSDMVNAEEFKTFASVLYERHPETIAMAWMPLANNETIQSLKERYQPEAYQYRIFKNGKIQSAEEPQDRDFMPIFYAYPDNILNQTGGFDLYSETERRTTIEQAVENGSRLKSTKPLQLADEMQGQGFLVFAPVYRTRSMPDNAADRWAEFEGVIVIAQRFQTIAQPIAEKWTFKGIDFFMTHDGPSNEILYSSEAVENERRLALSSDVMTTYVHDFLGQNLIFTYYINSDFSLANVNWSIWYALAFSLCFTFVITVFLLSITGQKARIERLVAQKTQELEESKIELKRSNKELEQFAYVASHDLKAPLRHITLSAGFLKEQYGEKLDKSAVKFLNVMEQSAERMQEMIDSLLEYSRVGRQEDRQFEAVDLKSVVDDVKDILAASIQERDSKITTYGLTNVTANRALMVQLLQNMIQNSIKYCPDNVHPEIKITGKAMDDSYRISVSDNGIGIDPSQADKIFMMFQRLHGEDAYEGTGIGLSICQRIVEFHRGTIKLDTKYKDGSKFIINLPYSIIQSGADWG